MLYNFNSFHICLWTNKPISMHYMIKQFSGLDQKHILWVLRKRDIYSHKYPHPLLWSPYLLTFLSSFTSEGFYEPSGTSGTKPTVSPGTAVKTTITIKLMLFMWLVGLSFTTGVVSVFRNHATASSLEKKIFQLKEYKQHIWFWLFLSI